MTPRTRAALLVAATATGVSWLAVGTSESLPALEPGRQGWSGDFGSYYLPNAEYLGARLADGALPFWNPHQAAGGPFLATLQVGALYPPNWLHALLPAQTAFLLLALLHLMGAVAAAGALAAALGAGPPGAALAGLAYAGSLQVVGAIWTPPVLYTAAWAPALWLAVDRAILRTSARAAAGVAAALAAGLLAGWPYTVAMSALGAAIYGSALLAARGARERRMPRAALGALLAGVLGGFALASPQLVPARELVAHSVRALGAIVEGQALGGGVTRPYDPAVFVATLTARGYNDGVPGVAALALAALAAALPGPGRARSALLLGVGALGIGVSFGEHLPLYGWLRELPVYGDFRFPFRYRLLTTLALAVAAGVGTTRLQERLAGRPRAARAAGVAALLVVAATAVLPVFRSVIPFARTWPAATGLAAELHERGGVAWRPGAGRLYWAGRAERLRLPADANVVYDLEPLTLARTAQLLTFFETGRPLTLLTLPKPPPGQRTGDKLAPPFFGYLVLPDTPRRARILDVLSVDTIAAESPPAWLDTRAERRSPPGAPLAVFANPHALPRAYRVTRALPEPAERGAAVASLVAPRFDPRSLVLLDDPPPALRWQPGRPLPADPGRAEITHDEPERIVVRAEGPTPGIVVLTDAWFPGWRARVDGRPADVLRANVALRAVAVPAGVHEVELRYRPTGFAACAGLALLALAACATAWRWGGPPSA